LNNILILALSAWLAGWLAGCRVCWSSATPTTLTPNTTKLAYCTRCTQRCTAAYHLISSVISSCCFRDFTNFHGKFRIQAFYVRNQLLL